MVFSLRLIDRGTEASPRQIFARMLDVLFAADAVVRVMQNSFKVIQNYMKSGAMTGPYASAQVMKQEFDFAPVDVALTGY
jgi:hypothetical protein